VGSPQSSEGAAVRIAFVAEHTALASAEHGLPASHPAHALVIALPTPEPFEIVRSFGFA
jgi:hypothetical protein